MPSRPRYAPPNETFLRALRRGWCHRADRIGVFEHAVRRSNHHLLNEGNNRRAACHPRRPAERSRRHRRQQTVRDVAEAEQVHCELECFGRHVGECDLAFAADPPAGHRLALRVAASQGDAHVGGLGRQRRREYLPDRKHLPGVRCDVPGDPHRSSSPHGGAPRVVHQHVAGGRSSVLQRAQVGTSRRASGKDVAHILVATQAKAQSILDQIKAGTPFATLAEADSTDTASGAQGGALGCLAPGEFVPAFETAAEKAPIGTPIGPVHSQFGYHIILVTRATSTYAAVATQVDQAIAQQGQTVAQNAIDALLKLFHVHLDPRFGTWGLTPNGQGQSVYEVSPPKPPSPSTQRNGTTTTTTTTVPVTSPGASVGTP